MSVNINKKPRHVANLGRHSYHMSQNYVTSAPVGELLPVYYDILNPGEKVNIRDQVNTISEAFQRYNFNKFEQHLDWFFVPYPMIWSFFEAFRSQTSSFNSSIFGDENGASLEGTFPHVPFSWLQDAFDAFPRSDTYGGVTISRGYDPVVESYRLFEAFDVPLNLKYVRNNTALSDLPQAQGSFNPQLFCAYQAIYQKYYRLDDWERFEPHSYNLDVSSLVHGDTNEYSNFNMFMIRFRPWKKDLFTNVYPSPLFSSNSLSYYLHDFSTDKIVYQDPKSPQKSQVPAGGERVEFNAGVTTSNTVALRTSELAQSFALQRWALITQNSRKDYDSQILSHFGYDVPKDVKHDVQYLGSHSSKIATAGIEATAAGTTGVDGSSSVLGELGGRAVTTDPYKQHEPIDFTAPCDGILMCIFSIVPESFYSPRGMNKVNQYLQPFDWFNPEFDELGMIPMFRYECDFHPLNSPTAQNQRLAWRYRYAELKQKFDKVGGVIARTRTDMLAQRKAADFTSNTSLSGLLPLSLYIHPNFTNPISLVQFRYDYGDSYYLGTRPSWGSDSSVATPLFESDPFYVDLNFNVIKRSTMRPYGLQRL